MRAGFDLYRAFEQDVVDTRDALDRGGKISAPVLGMHGEMSAFADVTEAMADESTPTPPPMRRACRPLAAGLLRCVCWRGRDAWIAQDSGRVRQAVSCGECAASGAMQG